MKKLFFVVLFVLFALSVFAQGPSFSTTYGIYDVSIQYKGQYVGREIYYRNFSAARENDYAIYVNGNEKLTKGELEAINYILDNYQTTIGDTYYVNLMVENPKRVIYQTIAVVEFTSDTQYTYWAYKSKYDYRYYR